MIGGVKIAYSNTSRGNLQPGEPSIGKAFNAMFSTYFGNFKEFFIFMLIFQGGIALLNIVNSGVSFIGIPFVSLIFNLGNAVLGFLMTGGLIAMAADAKIRGTTSKSRGFSLIGKKAAGIIVVNLVFGLAVVIGLCLCIIPGIIALIYLIWSTIIVVVEMADIGQSFDKSTKFAKEHSVALFILAYIGVGIIIALFQGILLAGPQLALLFGGLTIFGSGVSAEMAFLLITIISSLIGIPVASFFGPFLPIFITDYYLQAVGNPSEPMLVGEMPRRRENLDW